MTCRDCGFLVSRKRCRNPYPLHRYFKKLVDGNRARRARFPVPDADGASRSLRRDAPSFSSRPQGCRFASALAYRSHVAHSREPVLAEGPLCCVLFGRDCKLTSDALPRSALTEIPSPPVSHRICSGESRRLGYSSEQVVALLRSCCLAQRSRGFANPGSRYAFGRVLFRFLFPCRASR